MDELIAQIHVAIEEDEQWALACNRPYRHADEGAVAPTTGVHWRWAIGDNWDTVTPDPVECEYLEDSDGFITPARLATVEEWPTTLSWQHAPAGVDTRLMPRLYVDAEEVDSAVAGHIIRHDPAAVLAKLGGDREILRYVGELRAADLLNVARHLVHVLAKAYRVELPKD